MPIQAVNSDLADAINKMIDLLHRDYGADYAYSIMGHGFVLAQSNMYGVCQPKPLQKTGIDNQKNP